MVQYAEGASWAAAQGIVDGYGSGRFAPDDNITQEQLAVMLWRYAGSPAAAERELRFADADQASDWAAEALRWAVGGGHPQRQGRRYFGSRRAGHPRGNGADAEKFHGKVVVTSFPPTI